MRNRKQRRGGRMSWLGNAADWLADLLDWLLP
jgi:hypothetical protein